MAEDIDLARDGDEQPPEEHDNEAHSRDLVDAEEAADAAPVASVNGQTGDVIIEDEGGVPEGIISMWAGDTSQIPSGWILCDGANGAPDLTDRFVVGAGSQYNVGDTGGQDTASYDVSSTNIDDGGGSSSVIGSGGSRLVYKEEGGQYTEILGDRDVDPPSAGYRVSGQSAGGENRPQYYAIAYIQKV